MAAGAVEASAERDEAPNVAPASVGVGVVDVGVDAEPNQQQPANEDGEDVLMLPALQTGDMVVCPNPRRTGMLWPVSVELRRS